MKETVKYILKIVMVNKLITMTSLYISKTKIKVKITRETGIVSI